MTENPEKLRRETVSVATAVWGTAAGSMIVSFIFTIFLSIGLLLGVPEAALVVSITFLIASAVAFTYTHYRTDSFIDTIKTSLEES